MKIQGLAVIFIIIILPISLVLASYTQSRVETLRLQTEYDSKLNDATYDALKAYQLNSFNSDTADLVNSKMRDIKASANTFFNSVATNFSSIGYTKETIQRNYIPAIVYTMYDGYYIYSPYTNTWDQEAIVKNGSTSSFQNGEILYGLKPYVYYSCRYKRGNADVVITYSLDNYIQIQGTVNGKAVSVYGYLLNGNDVVINGDDVIYKGITIGEEYLTETLFAKNSNDGLNMYTTNNGKELPYKKINGIKYYYSSSENQVFWVLNGKMMNQATVSSDEIKHNKSAKQYYKEAKDLYNFINSYADLRDLSTSDIIDKSGYNYTEGNGMKIFDFDNIEKEDSNFNTHRIDVIKNSIVKNLSIAIANFNNSSNVSGVNFQMPKLKDTDWDKIMDNISIITFMQGINIGGKIYNGYSIVTNTKNEDIVMNDSIYIQAKHSNGDIILHNVKDNILVNGSDVDIIRGIYNVNLERRSVEYNSGYKYFFPVNGTLSYNSIVTQNGIVNTDINEYLNGLNNANSKNNVLKKAYYTALARERYGLARQKLEIKP